MFWKSWICNIDLWLCLYKHYLFDIIIFYWLKDNKNNKNRVFIYMYYSRIKRRQKKRSWLLWFHITTTKLIGMKFECKRYVRRSDQYQSLSFLPTLGGTQAYKNLLHCCLCHLLTLHHSLHRECTTHHPPTTTTPYKQLLILWISQVFFWVASCFVLG